jgi:hypothetical protein
MEREHLEELRSRVRRTLSTNSGGEGTEFDPGIVVKPGELSDRQRLYILGSVVDQLLVDDFRMGEELVRLRDGGRADPVTDADRATGDRAAEVAELRRLMLEMREEIGHHRTALRVTVAALAAILLLIILCSTAVLVAYLVTVIR